MTNSLLPLVNTGHTHSMKETVPASGCQHVTPNLVSPSRCMLSHCCLPLLLPLSPKKQFEMNVFCAEDEPLKYGAAGSPGFCDLLSAKMELKTQLTEQYQKQIPSFSPPTFTRCLQNYQKAKRELQLYYGVMGKHTRNYRNST